MEKKWLEKSYFSYPVIIHRVINKLYTVKMKIIAQRVHKSTVKVEGQSIGSIQKGLLLLVGIKKGDTEEEAQWLINKVLNLRIFEDEEGKMNKSVTDINGAILLVPNFTLYADASQGNRPGFGAAEAPEKARRMYKRVIEMINDASSLKIETGEFGADMDVELINDGPVTIILEK